MWGRSISADVTVWRSRAQVWALPVRMENVAPIVASVGVFLLGIPEIPWLSCGPGSRLAKPKVPVVFEKQVRCDVNQVIN